jgi:hypothetical protein
MAVIFLKFSPNLGAKGHLQKIHAIWTATSMMVCSRSGALCHVYGRYFLQKFEVLAKLGRKAAPAGCQCAVCRARRGGEQQCSG